MEYHETFENMSQSSWKKVFPVVLCWILLTLESVNASSVANTNSDCKIHATIIRQVENTGFHRDLSSLVELVTSHADALDNCTILLREKLPSGLYVDPDQLQNFRKQNMLSACPNMFVDVEKPEWESNPFEVHVYSTLEKTHNLLSTFVTLPIHLRYHRAVPRGGHTEVYVKQPQMLLRCETDVACSGHSKYISAPCSACSREQCKWLKIPFKSNTPSSGFILEVPVGNSVLHSVVTLGTLLVTGGGSLYIMAVLFGHWSD